MSECLKERRRGSQVSFGSETVTPGASAELVACPQTVAFSHLGGGLSRSQMMQMMFLVDHHTGRKCEGGGRKELLLTRARRVATRRGILKGRRGAAGWASVWHQSPKAVSFLSNSKNLNTNVVL